ncbi:hypothetical protein CDAR_317921 [Caerostris darwini]|uniref:Uncharacterized protein n=1 Tax=Caerostris darwini TaxID=1538125 RepID=A0AAV4WTS6_9ARAC|nr:hypothetical protein CDAR_317921 [Caerostris darwini]
MQISHLPIVTNPLSVFHCHQTTFRSAVTDSVLPPLSPEGRSSTSAVNRLTVHLQDDNKNKMTPPSQKSPECRLQAEIIHFPPGGLGDGLFSPPARGYS